MKAFLKKYGISDEVIASITAAYVEKHKDDDAPPKELPVHIAKARLDELTGQKKGVEEALKVKQAEYDTLNSELEKLKTAGGDATTTALAAAKKEWEKAKKAEIDALNKGFETKEAILTAKGKNVKAIAALIDPTKDVKEEIARLQKDEAYLFGDDDGGIPFGTGKGGSDKGNAAEKELESMRAAVGLTGY